jgi:hypothetical protein
MQSHLTLRFVRAILEIAVARFDIDTHLMTSLMMTASLQIQSEIQPVGTSLA